VKDCNPDECYNCGKIGHFVRNYCAEKKVKENTNLVTEEETKEGLFMMVYDERDTNNEKIWYLDTGASNHMCRYKHLFTEIRVIEDRHVSFGDASKIQVKGQGIISYLQKNGLKGLIENVYYVPNLKSNILSMG
jgi:Zinc knuckle